MTSSPQTRQTRLAFVAGVVLALVASATLAQATTSSAKAKGVRACVSSTGVLSLLKNGSCAQGTKAVTIAKKGKRGPAGQTGPAGPAGPGAQRLLFATNTPATTALAAIEGWTFSGACSSSGGAYTASLLIAPPAGVTFSVDIGAVYRLSGASDANLNLQTATTPVTTNFPNFSGTFVSSTGSIPANNLLRLWANTFHVSAANGDFFSLEMRMSANALASPAPGESRCMIEGTVTPAA